VCRQFIFRLALGLGHRVGAAANAGSYGLFGWLAAFGGALGCPLERMGGFQRLDLLG
jgi:hypothetical protein